MADSSLIGSASIDIDKIRAKLQGISAQNITLSINSQDIISKINNIKNELNALSKSQYDITLNISDNAQVQIQNLKSQLDGINKQTKQAGRKTKQSTKKDENGAFPVSRREWAKKYKNTAQAEVDKYLQTLRGQGATPLSSSLKAKFDKTGKITGYDGIVNYRNEVGKTTQAILSMDAATKVWKVSSTSVNTSYEAQAKEIEKVNNYLSQQENAYKNLESTAFAQKGALDKNSPYGEEALKSLQEYQNGIEAIRNGQKEYNADSRRELDTLRNNAKIKIAEQKEQLRLDTEAQKTREKAEAQQQKQIDQAVKRQQKIDADAQAKTQREADYNSKFLANQDIGIKDLESKAFNQNNPLTGDFKKTADEAVAYWKNKVEEARSYSGKLTQEQENQIKEAEAAAKRTVIEQQKSQWRGDKLAAKDVGQKVSNANWGLDIQVEELKQAGQYTEQAQQKIENLRKSLAEVKDQKGFDEWSKQLQQFNQELELAGEKAKTAFKNESMQLDLENLQTRLTNIKQKYDEFVESNPSKADSGIEASFERISEAINSINTDNIDPQKLALLRKEVRNFASDVNGIVTPAQSLGQILTQNLGGIGQYLARFTSAFYLINKGIQTVKSMVNEVKSLDTSLMELQKVTTLSGDSLAQFTDNAYKTGKEVGRTGKDVIDAVTTFSRAGYDLQESNELAKAALTMTNVGVDIPSTEAAASDMISILKAFDKQADESMEVIDKLYNVANKEPLDFGNITEMLVTAGGTLAQAGTSLEETMGLLTGGFATLRNSSVANG